MNWPAITDRVMLGATVVLILYNVLAGVMGGRAATISGRMEYLGPRYPIIVGAAFGILAHWWWRVGPTE